MSLLWVGSGVLLHDNDDRFTEPWLAILSVREFQCDIVG